MHMTYTRSALQTNIHTTAMDTTPPYILPPAWPGPGPMGDFVFRFVGVCWRK